MAAAKPGTGKRDYKVLAERLIAEADAALVPGEERGTQPLRDLAERGHLGALLVLSLLLASAFFLLIHFVVSGTRLRDALVARVGEGAYRGAFSLASLVGILWMSHAYSQRTDDRAVGYAPRPAPAWSLWSYSWLCCSW